jgi:peptidyl-prolyl cis-trans isomerase D
MITSIKKFITSFFAKILIIIIILPFLFWGMGDVFRTGNQNVVATIESEKISSQEFIGYINRLNLNEQQRSGLGKTDLLDRILADYISKKIIDLEIRDLGINLTDKALSYILLSDVTFHENKKFSRTKYEKFLLKSGVSAPAFEQNISQQEKRRQLLTFLSEGTKLPEFLIERAYQEENQIKTVQYIELDKFYRKIKVKEEEIKKIYNSNKDLFLDEYKSISYAELTPTSLTGQPEFNELYFKKIDEIENTILDGAKIQDFAKDFNLSITTTEEVNRLKKNRAGDVTLKINNDLFSKTFRNKNLNSPELINIKNKYYISELVSFNKMSRTLNDKEVRDAIINQIKIKNIIDSNNKIIKNISEGKFNKIEMENYAKNNALTIQSTVIKDIKDKSIFTEEIIKKIFKFNDGTVELVTNSLLKSNYIVFIEKTKKLSIDKNMKDYDLYKSKAKLNLADNIFRTYDKSINTKYKVDVNQKAISRIKNTL